MSTVPDHVAVFEAERPRLRALAYRMTGSIADAEDVVQDAWMRWDRLGDAGRGAVVRPDAWLTTATSRLALDVLTSARRQREQYVGPWLPEPVLTDDDPASTVELAESLTIGFLVVLERLAPVERAVFLLADVFGEPFDRIADAVDRSEEACRQIASRARRRVREEHRRVAEPVVGRRDELVHSFLAACLMGQVEELRRVLLDDVVLVSDGGREVHAARRPVVGFDRVSRLIVNLATRVPADVAVEVHEVNGEPGLLVLRDERPLMVMALETVATADGDRIAAVRLMLNPAKLRGLAPTHP